MTLLIRQGKEEVARVEIVKEETLDLPAGTYQAFVAESQEGLEIDRSEFTLSVAGRRQIRVVKSLLDGS